MESYENFDGLMLDNGTDVMYEHHEEWHWTTGESAVLKFVSVHKVAERQDHAVEGLLGHGRAGQPCPPTWMEDFANADMSWIFDATGLV